MEFTPATNFLSLGYFEFEFAATFETNYPLRLIQMKALGCLTLKELQSLWVR